MEGSTNESNATKGWLHLSLVRAYDLSPGGYQGEILPVLWQRPVAEDLPAQESITAPPNPPTSRVPNPQPVRQVYGAGEGWQEFRQGYRDGGGRPEWEDKFVRVLDGCEGSVWAGYYGQNGYWSRAQFSRDTWAKVKNYLLSVLGAADPDAPYHVGYGVAWWSRQADPANQWPVCWRTR